jgi:hypothetical protein
LLRKKGIQLGLDPDSAGKLVYEFSIAVFDGSGAIQIV